MSERTAAPHLPNAAGRGAPLESEDVGAPVVGVGIGEPDSLVALTPGFRQQGTSAREAARGVLATTGRPLDPPGVAEVGASREPDLARRL